MKTYTSSDRNATPTATPARPLRPNLAEAMTWTPRPVEEPRPTASGYEPPTPEDDVENDAWSLGYSGETEDADPPADLPDGLKATWRRSFADGCDARWEDFAAVREGEDRFEDILSSMRDTYADEMAERYARSEFAGHGGYADLD